MLNDVKDLWILSKVKKAELELKLMARRRNVKETKVKKHLDLKHVGFMRLLMQDHLN